MFATLLQDLRYGIRALRRDLGFTAVVIVTLALAIGANTVIFSFTNVLLLRPLPIRDPDRVAWFFGIDPARGRTRADSSYPDYLDWRDGARSFESLAAMTQATYTMTGRGEPRRLRATRVTGNFFSTWGVRPVRGRFFGPPDDRPGAPRVAVLSHRFWKAQLGGAESTIGESLTLDGSPYTVVGVMMPEMEIGNISLIDVWVPLATDPATARRDLRNLRVTGRLEPGVSLEAADAEVRAMTLRLQQQYPDSNKGWGVQVVSTKTAMVGEDSWLVLGLLIAVVVFVLLIACANLANLVLARQVARRRELAVRAALGASRRRLVWQLVMESGVLGIAGGALGLAVGEAGLRIIRAAAYEPFFQLVTIDRNVLLFGLGLSFVTPLLFSLLPALNSSRDDLTEALKEGGARTLGGRHVRRSRNGLVVAQVALAVVLLVLAGLVLRTMAAITAVDQGFDPRGLLTLHLDLPEWKYKDDGTVARFYREALDRIAALPAVRSAGAVRRLPIVEADATARFEIDGRPIAKAEDRPWAAGGFVSRDYFSTTGIPLVRGRAFAASDTTDAPRVAVISTEMARRYWTNADAAVGARIRLESPQGGLGPAVEIVGVVGNTANPDVERAPDPTFYLPIEQAPQRALWIVARGDDPSALAAPVRTVIHSVDPDLAIYQMRPLTIAIEDELSSSQILMGLFVAFAILALLLAAAGLYGVVAYSVSQRLPEMGVRMALGALPGDIRRLVFGQSLKLAAIGLVAGLAGALATARIAAKVLFGVTPTDPLTYGTVLGLLMTVALAASYVPARRAARVDPAKSLRLE